jgi:hypothetical protein
MSIKDRILEKIERFALSLIKLWYVDLTIAIIGFSLFLIVEKIRKHKT